MQIYKAANVQLKYASFWLKFYLNITIPTSFVAVIEGNENYINKILYVVFAIRCFNLFISK